MRRQAASERIANEIIESTAGNLLQILANMRVTGFGVIKNYKKLANRNAFDMDGSSSDENQSSSEARHKCVFAEGNLPDVGQAYYHETAGWNTTGTAKTPKHDILFEGVSINSRDYDFKTRMSKLESDELSGRVPRQAMAANEEQGTSSVEQEVHGTNARHCKRHVCERANDKRV
jgi:hypothetical protein